MSEQERFAELKKDLDKRKSDTLARYLKEFEDGTPRGQRSMETMLMFALSKMARIEVCVQDALIGLRDVAVKLGEKDGH